MDQCAEACRSLGAWAELVALLVIGLRWMWAEIARRRAVEAKAAVQQTATELRQEVRQLSLRPPAMGSIAEVKLQIQATPNEPASSPIEAAHPPATEKEGGDPV